MKPSRPYDPARYTSVPELLALAVEMEDRIAELEAAMRALIAERWPGESQALRDAERLLQKPEQK